MQPWLVRLEGADRLTLFCDLNQLLPETDPPNRQIVIGLGAFLELMRQAALEVGYALDIEAFPQGEPYPVLDGRPVAHITFIPNTDQPKDPLFGFALARRTARVKFDLDRPVDAAALNRLGAALRPGDGAFSWVNDAANVESLRALCRKSWRIELETAPTRAESVRLTRIGEQEINQNPDGISLSGPMIEAMGAAGLLTRAKLDQPGSAAYRGTLDFYNGLIDASPAFGWLAAPGNARRDQLAAGAGWIRLHLAATRDGLGLQPLSQCLQEFPEMAGPFEEIHDFTKVSAPGRVQGLFRFGYASMPAPAPRWPLSSRIISDA